VKTPQGVRKINENVLQEKRALILTDEQKDNYDFTSLPDGTTYIDTTTGNEYVKLKGQTDWVAKNVKQDNTIAIMKDSMVVNEVFTVKSIDTTNKTFVYDTDTGQQRTGKIDSEGHFVFRLDKGTYLPGRNHLSVKIDGVLERTVEYGNLVELNEYQFYVTDELQVGHRLVISYIEWIRIGNPYPRCFMMDDEPQSSEIGDLWIDTNAYINSDGDLVDDGEDIPDGKTINWNNIINTPTTLDGYGIVDAATKYHTHKVADITDFPTSMKANGGNADTVGNHAPGTSAGNVLVLDGNGQIPLSVLPTEGLFHRGMIMDWYGQSNQVPSGWHICDGTNGTPDLRDKFIISAGGKYSFLATGGEEAVTLDINKIPNHDHWTDDGGNHRHYTCDFIHGMGWPIHSQDENNPGGVRLHASDDWTNRWGSDWGDSFTSWAGNHNHHVRATGGGQAHNNMPPYIALFKIMKL
jgi:microcystin-dependent protein